MSDVTRRTLRLLSLLQSRAVWGGEELAAELGVTPRSVRRDIDRLRQMGYPVLASQGHGGGYRLGAGRALPPLLLESDEATAVAVGLRLAASSGVDGLGERALRALAALEPVLPPAVREEVAVVAGVLDVVSSRAESVASPVLVTLARATRDTTQLRVEYVRADGERSRRRLEPYRVLSIDGRWYLFAWDLDREDWRTFRLDRVLEARASTFRFTPRPVPDIEAHVRRSVGLGPYRAAVTVRVLRPYDEVAPEIAIAEGVVEPDGEGSCLLRMGAHDASWVVLYLAHRGLPIEPVDPPKLADVIDELGAWFDATRARRAAASGPTAGDAGATVRRTVGDGAREPSTRTGDLPSVEA